ncbi:hypothetical protein BD410DRAFT_86774 [Rickenella mellea]|uniref:Uncharacterized protein n=1 Tax=Rickenella mellea TaxID=50990 RepID=A0A4Y7PLQ3_9AGAM|nr:hypothetical protein BD410DRAFT_86774 [Rickenella mellea]
MRGRCLHARNVRGGRSDRNMRGTTLIVRRHMIPNFGPSRTRTQPQSIPPKHFVALSTRFLLGAFAILILVSHLRPRLASLMVSTVHPLRPTSFVTSTKSIHPPRPTRARA